MAPSRRDMEIHLVAVLIRIIGITRQLCLYMLWRTIMSNRTNQVRRALPPPDAPVIRSLNIRRMVYESDRGCIENIRMDRRCFFSLCGMLKEHGKLAGTVNTSVEEMVIAFLHIIGHGIKNRIVKRQLCRSDETISRHIHSVLKAIILCTPLLLAKADPVPANSNDGRWKWFKNCMGALDGTHIRVTVLEEDKPRYRSRKGEISTNVLGACTQDMQFIYVLFGWEGSAEDTRVLQDAVNRKNGLKVPKGQYFLVDANYTNSEGFLAPYRGERYHLNQWCIGQQPTTPREFFNMKHSQARNTIERAFGLLKARWAILRTRQFYPVKTHCRIIGACCLLHNFIRIHMPEDPMDDFDLGAYNASHGAENDDIEEEIISTVESSSAWSKWRDDLAVQMFNEWRSNQ